MNKKPLIIDCDPGIDDAIALLLLYKHKHLFDIKLICATAGNCSVETTLNNIKYFAKNYFPEAVVAKGSKNPLVKTNAQNAEDVHGESGLGLVKLTKQTYPHLENSVEAMKDVLFYSKDKLTIITLGALTNIAKLVINYPELKDKIDRIYSMGGSIFGNGNIEPYAEFNAYSDPEAFDIVAKAGVPIVINPLELAQNSKIPKETIKKYKPQNEKQQFAFDIASSMNEFQDPENIGIYDAHSVLALIKPEFYNFVPCDIEIYTNSEVRGKCVLTKNEKSKNYFQILKNADETNNFILNELFSL